MDSVCGACIWALMDNDQWHGNRDEIHNSCVCMCTHSNGHGDMMINDSDHQYLYYNMHYTTEEELLKNELKNIHYVRDVDINKYQKSYYRYFGYSW